MGDWTPAYISLGILFLLGFFIPTLVSNFTDVTVHDHESYLTPIIDFVTSGFNFDLPLVGDVNFNPFSWFGQTVHSFIVTQLNAFSYIPAVITLPLIIFILFGFLYTIIKMLPTT